MARPRVCGWRRPRAWEGIQRPYPVAVARWRAAESAGRARRTRRGCRGRPLALALAEVSARGGWWPSWRLVERARLELGRAGEKAGGKARRRTGSGSAGEPDPFGLTKRERQVLALVAEGATNRQIGTALFMAEKTASVHVSRILAKLGVQSRTQAAAVVHRLPDLGA